MKNKKGFTLIELLVTVALIATISITVSINVLNMAKNQKEKEVQQFKTLLENAACTFADVKGITKDSGINTISTCNLIKDGYLKKVKIPGTEYVLGNQKNVDISISWDSSTGEKTCSYNVNQTPNDVLTCPDIDGETYYWNDNYSGSYYYSYPLGQKSTNKTTWTSGSPITYPTLAQLQSIYGSSVDNLVYIKTTVKHQACLHYNNHDFCVSNDYWEGTMGVNDSAAGIATKNKLQSAMEVALGTSADSCTSSNYNASCSFGPFECDVSNFGQVKCADYLAWCIVDDDGSALCWND